MNALRPTDSHLHIGSLERMDDLLRYASALNLGILGLLSLPTVGSGPDGDITVNYNPEILAAAAVLRQVMPDVGVFGYGSFDNRALCGVDGLVPRQWDPESQVKTLFAAGFDGLKLWEGKPGVQQALRVTLDDARFIAAFDLAAELAMPVLVHVADPRIFWTSDKTPWSYAKTAVPSFEELIAQAETIAIRCPATRFIFPHLLFLADNLPRLAALLERAPNVLVDLAPGNYLYPELGGIWVTPQGRNEDRAAVTAAREFFIRYADRILVGSDAFFYSAGDAVLPSVSLQENLTRYLRLFQFLTGSDLQASPFTVDSDRPIFRGLALPPRVAQPILSDNATNVLTSTRTLSADVRKECSVDYLKRWAPEENPLRDARRTAAIRVIDEGLL